MVDHPEYRFKECLRDKYLYQTVTEPTRHRHGQNSNILDLVITNDENFVKDIAYSIHLGASDHVSLLVTIEGEPKLNSDTTMRRNFYKGDYNAFREDLSQVD